MKKVSIRDLRNNGGDVIDRVIAGEHLLVIRDGKPVAELKPTSNQPLEAGVLLERWRHLPAIDAESFRKDFDAYWMQHYE